MYNILLPPEKYCKMGEKEEVITSIYTTESDHHRMQNVSKLGFEDPVDNVTMQSAAFNTLNRESRRSSRGEDSPRPGGNLPRIHPAGQQLNRTEDVGAFKPQVRKATAGVGTKNTSQQAPLARARIRRAKSNDSKFQFPSMLTDLDSENQSENQSARKPRSRSLDNDECLLEMKFESPPVQVTIHESEGASRTPPVASSPSSEVGVSIQPTTSQRQLMRQMSALGLEDPVFGDDDNKLRPRHASMFFDDMDFSDVPEDMRDLLSVASDHTDEVVLDRQFQGDSSNDERALEYPIPLPSMQEEFSDNFSPVEVKPDSVPPMGSYSLKKSSQSSDQEFATPRSGRRTLHAQFRRSIPKPLHEAHSESRSNSNDSAFIPATGSFNKRKPKKSASGDRDRESFLKDIAIAAQNIAIEARVEALFPNDTQKKPSKKEDLDLSFSNLNNSISYFNEAFGGTKKPMTHRPYRLPARAKRQSSNIVNESCFVPPAAPQQMVNPINHKEHRILPSKFL